MADLFDRFSGSAGTLNGQASDHGPGTWTAFYVPTDGAGSVYNTLGSSIGTKRKILIGLLKTHALKHGDFLLSSGKRSSYYLDVRQVTLRSAVIDIIVNLLIDLIDKEFQGSRAIGVMAIGDDPIIGDILVCVGQDCCNKLGFIVRKEPKDHGTGRQVEGPVESGMKVVIVEDVATTGASALAAADAVIAMGCTVSGIIAVVDRLEGAAEACAARGIPFKSLVTIRDLGITF